MMKRKLTMILMMLGVSIGFGLAGAQSANAAAGEKIAFASRRDGNFEIYVMNADGSNQTRLTNIAASDAAPSWGAQADGDGDGIGDACENTAPVANNDGFNTNENTTLNVSAPGVLANDTDGENDALTATLLAIPTNAVSFVFNPDGSFSYTPTANFIGSDSFTYRVSDGAANSLAATVFITVNDSTPPVITPNVTGTLGDNGWYRSDIGVSWTVTDSGSPISVQTGCNAQTVSTDTSGVTFTCTATSGGGTSVQSITVKRDATNPNISFVSRTPAANTNGWNNTNVTVNWSCSDALSGAVNPTVSQTLTSEGAALSSIGTCTDNAGNSASDTQSGIKIDKTAPVITFVSRTAPNLAGWNNTNVTVNWSCSDALSGAVNSSVSQTVSTEGLNQSSIGTCTDNAGNSASNTQSGIKIDKTAPTLAPTVSPNPVLLGGTATATANATDALSGIASQSCAATNTATVGSKTAACTATDLAGNTANAVANYRVVYNFAGFFQPVDNLPVINAATAGSSIPVKFSLSGNQGLAIFAAGYPTSGVIPCAGDTTSTIEETVTAGNSTLTYDAATGQYKYVWKTERAWSGTCRQLQVRFIDGNTYVANFSFR